MLQDQVRTRNGSRERIVHLSPLRITSDFFTAGQVLPTYRLKHSTQGGLFQPTVTQAIRLLSAQPYGQHTSSVARSSSEDRATTVSDPFTTGELTYSTNGIDRRIAPSTFPRNRHSWVHIFPEGMVHQHATTDVRYFKWGVARLILEAEPSPDIIPMFIDGTQNIMHEDRKFPRFLPRIGKQVRVAFGERLDFDATFGDLRKRWQGLVKKRRTAQLAEPGSTEAVSMLGELTDDELRFGQEAIEIREEVARRVRESVLKVRASLGYPASDPSYGYAETWAHDGKDPSKKKYKSRVDQSQINQD